MLGHKNEKKWHQGNFETVSKGNVGVGYADKWTRKEAKCYE